MSAIVILSLIVSTLASSAGLVLFRYGGRGNTQVIEFLNVWIILGFVCYVVAAVTGLYSLSRVSAVSVFPFTVLQAVLISFYSAVFLGETLSAGSLAGCALALLGLFLVVKSGG
ncbi:MAG: EamA family transporter [Alphaproteobacteria bacterium]|nr:EamA family transporter [Alphaproteobacteria bacterium]